MRNWGDFIVGLIIGASTVLCAIEYLIAIGIVQ